MDLPALPLAFSSEARINRLTDALVRMEAQPLHRYLASRAKNLRRVPLQVGDATDRETRKALFMPSDLLKENIGSNIGLIRILENLQLQLQHHVRYQPVLADINIFNRCLKVEYSLCTLN